MGASHSTLGKGRSAVFGMEAGDELGFGFRQVEWRAVGFGRGGNDIHHERHQHESIVGERKPDAARLLRFHDALHAERTSHHQAGEQSEGERDFIADQLRGAAQGSKQRIVAVRRPAAENDSQNAHRRHRHDHQNSYVHIRYEQVLAERQDRERGKGGERRNDRRDPENRSVGVGRDDVFLEQELQGVRNGLQQAVRADPHGAKADLKIG